MERVSHERRRSVNFIVRNLKRRAKYRESAHQRKNRKERKQRIQSIVIRVEICLEPLSFYLKTTETGCTFIQR